MVCLHHLPRPAVFKAVNAGPECWEGGSGLFFVYWRPSGFPKGFPWGGWEGRERPGGPFPRARGTLESWHSPEDTGLLPSPALFQLSETTAESHLMEKELEELKSISRRRK